MGWLWRKDKVTKDLQTIRASNGTVLLDEENITADADIKRGAAKLWAITDFVEPDFWSLVRSAIAEAARESKRRRQLNARSGTQKAPVHPYVLIHSEQMDVSFEFHRCNSRICCADR